MKTFILIISLSLAMACSPENITPTEPVDPSEVDLTNATLLKEGMFTGIGGHVASGTVKIYEKAGSDYIVFDPYSSQSGPDLKVYLSKDEKATDYIRVGQLMSTTGKQVYKIPGDPNLSQFPFVHIWCEKYSVEFARAQMN